MQFVVWLHESLNPFLCEFVYSILIICSWFFIKFQMLLLSMFLFSVPCYPGGRLCLSDLSVSFNVQLHVLKVLIMFLLSLCFLAPQFSFPQSALCSCLVLSHLFLFASTQVFKMCLLFRLSLCLCLSNSGALCVFTCHIWLPWFLCVAITAFLFPVEIKSSLPFIGTPCARLHFWGQSLPDCDNL